MEWLGILDLNAYLEWFRAEYAVFYHPDGLTPDVTVLYRDSDRYLVTSQKPNKLFFIPAQFIKPKEESHENH